MHPPRPAWPFLVALAPVALLHLALTVYLSVVNYSEVSGSRRIGYVMGAVMVWPAIVAGLFAISPRFRTLRRQAIVTLVVFGVMVLSDLARIGAHLRPQLEKLTSTPSDTDDATDTATYDDEAVLAEVKQRSAELQREAIESDDVNLSVDLQGRMRQVLEDALPRLSPTSRAELTLTLRILNPFMDEAQAYMAGVAEFGNSGQADFTAVTTREHIAAGLATIKLLDAANTSLLARIIGLDAEAEAALAKTDLSRAKRRAILQGFRSSLAPKIDPLREIRELDSRLYEQYRLAFEHLDTTWGRWRIPEEGGISWDVAEEESAFDAMIEAIQTIAAEQGVVQQRLLPQ